MSETISCTSCGNAFAKGDRFCPKCGTQADMGSDTASNLETRVAPTSPTVCVKCSADMGRDDLFCPKCGTGRPEEATVVSHVSLRNSQAAHLAESTRGEFEVLQQLGLGAMGSVYLAKDIALSRKVAIKVIASNLLQDESMVSRFRLEAQTVASLRHPNIVNVHAVRQADDLHYFVMDFIDGPPLRSLVKNHAPLQIPVVQALLYQIGSALDYAHHRGKGVIHRDIKPANIMVDREGNAFVTDFGISKIAESQTGLTQTGATIGTPEYMSPEQCRGEDLTGASDQYAVGIMAYEMLTGKTPFSGSQYYIMVAHTSEEPEPITSLRPDCPPHVAEAVHRMLAKVPTDRWPDLESGMAAMGGKPLGRKDPIRQHITALAGSTGAVDALDASSPLSPLPGKPAGPSTDTATSITVLGVPTRVEEGDSFTLSADVRGQTQGSMPGVGVNWTSTDSSVAVVTNGQVRALKAGTAVISAAVGGVTNSVSVHVAQAAPVSIVIDPHTVHVSSGERVSLRARVQDKHGKDMDRVIRWLTSDAGVASVTREGELVATGSGVATVTAESSGVTGTAEIVVQGTGARVPVGLQPPKRPAWRHPAVLAAAIVLLGAGGVFGAMQAGLIGGAGGAGDAAAGSDTPPAAGGPAVAEVLVTLPQNTLTVGDSMRVAFVANDASGAPVSGAEAEWAAVDPASARINGDWVVAQRAGPIELSALVSGITGTASFQANAAPAQVAANTSAAPSQPAQEPEEEETPPPQESRPAQRDNTPAAERPSPQNTPPQREELPSFVPTPSALDVDVPTRIDMNSTARIGVNVLDQNGDPLPSVLGDVRLSSSNPSVIQVDQGAMQLRALSEGSANISASVLGLTAGPFPVTVPSPLQGVDVTSDPLSLEVGETGRARATARGPGGGPLVGYPVSWSSSNGGVATVSGDGTVTAVSAGSATLTATSGTFSAETSVTVTAAAPVLPSANEIRFLLDGYLDFLNDDDQAGVSRLAGQDSGDLDDLLDWMDNNSFQAVLGEIDSSGGTTIMFGVSMSYRSGFGGDQNRDRQFRAILTQNGGEWGLQSVVMLPE